MDNGKTREEMDVASTVSGNKMAAQMRQSPAPTVLTPSHDQQSQLTQQTQPPKKKMPFIPPLKGAANLGLSTLIQENGKTKEEQDVASTVAGNKMAMGMPKP